MWMSAICSGSVGGIKILNSLTQLDLTYLYYYKEDIPICDTAQEIKCSTDLEIDSKKCTRQN